MEPLTEKLNKKSLTQRRGLNTRQDRGDRKERETNKPED